MSMAIKKNKFKWVYRSSGLKKERVPSFYREQGILDGVARIMIRRGVDTQDKLEHFLYDTLDNLTDPFLMKGMEEAVIRIQRAINQKEKIVIYGDYDVDGITSTAILVRYLMRENAEVSFYIPSREEEGYGLNQMAIEKLAKAGNRLLVTVDCGISSADLVANSPSSMDIIITDHHQPPEILPSCIAVVNPHQSDCPYPYKELAGCGVAFTLCRALYKRKYKEIYTDDVELVALGTIADVVSLTGENRILVRKGMERFLTTPIKGLAALLRATGIVNSDTKEFLHADQISFGLAPRLNAAGRITHAKYGVELLTTNSSEEAEQLAKKLCDTNIERQKIEREIYEEALERIAELHIENDKVLVIDGKDWHPGVIGIVASRILDLYHRPVLVMTIRNGIGKGSCRSIPAFNIYQALGAQSEMLIQYGGHKMAAGFSISEENIELFRKKINLYAENLLTPDDGIPLLELEETLPLEEITLDFIRSLDLLEPYGCDNPKPLFSVQNVFIETARRIGNDKRHFKCRLIQNTEPVEAIFWNAGQDDPCHAGDTVNLVFEPEIHDWYGEHVQLICKDVELIENHSLSREFLVKVFIALRAVLKNNEILPAGDVKVALRREINNAGEPAAVYTALAIFEELAILSRFSRSGTDYYQRRVVQNKKLDLLSSSIYRKYRK